jgi:hypothetical protein
MSNKNREIPSSSGAHPGGAKQEHPFKTFRKMLLDLSRRVDGLSKVKADTTALVKEKVNNVIQDKFYKGDTIAIPYREWSSSLASAPEITSAEQAYKASEHVSGTVKQPHSEQKAEKVYAPKTDTAKIEGSLKTSQALSDRHIYTSGKGQVTQNKIDSKSFTEFLSKKVQDTELHKSINKDMASTAPKVPDVTLPTQKVEPAKNQVSVTESGVSAPAAQLESPKDSGEEHAGINKPGQEKVERQVNSVSSAGVYPKPLSVDPKPMRSFVDTTVRSPAIASAPRVDTSSFQHKEGDMRNYPLISVADREAYMQVMSGHASNQPELLPAPARLAQISRAAELMDAGKLEKDNELYGMAQAVKEGRLREIADIPPEKVNAMLNKAAGGESNASQLFNTPLYASIVNQHNNRTKAIHEELRERVTQAGNRAANRGGKSVFKRGDRRLGVHGFSVADRVRSNGGVVHTPRMDSKTYTASAAVASAKGSNSHSTSSLVGAGSSGFESSLKNMQANNDEQHLEGLMSKIRGSTPRDVYSEAESPAATPAARRSEGSLSRSMGTVSSPGVTPMKGGSGGDPVGSSHSKSERVEMQGTVRVVQEGGGPALKFDGVSMKKT